MDIASPDLRTRRALIAGAGGAIAALVAQTFGRPLGARAEGEAIVVGGEYLTATSVTLIRNNTNDQAVLRAESAAGGTGVVATSGSFYGVYGGSVSATGVRGEGAIGVAGDSDDGIGVNASSSENIGLRIERGRMVVSEVSGVATIPAGSTSRTVSPGVNVVPASFVLLTPRVRLGGRDLWYTTSPATDSFTIRMGSPRTSPTKVAWLLLG